MNSLEKLYKEFGSEICLCPFFGAFYQTNNIVPIKVERMPNTVRPCSLIAYDDITQWSVTNSSITESRNNSNWKRLRQDFLNQNFAHIPDCKICRENEQKGATSPRMMNNKFLCDQLGIDVITKLHQIENNNCEVSDILTLDYYPSNYCDYSCVMCSGGASSQRHVFEFKVLNHRGEKILVNATDSDFYQLLEKVEIINFTGGETVLQKQVHELIDYLIQHGRAKDVMITLLTNASSYPDKLMEKFSQFKGVVYNISIDGIGDVIEYQRRGCKWPTVETNSVKLINLKKIGIVINYVLTAINVFSAMDFVNWARSQQFGPTCIDDLNVSFINISPVFRLDFLGQSVLPPELKKIALNRLYQGRDNYQARPDVIDMYYTRVIEQIISVVESEDHRPAYLPQFVDYIKREDSVSKKSLVQVVPEWAPYF